MSQSTSSEPSPVNSFKIYVDADACPVALKEIVFKAAKRMNIETVLVANAKMRIPAHDLFSLILVPSGADKADQKIVELVKAGDVVITADIPLAALVVEKKAIAIGTRGELFDDNSIGERLAIRNMMDQARAAGIETRGPKPQNNKDIQAFANRLDATLSKRIRRR